MTDRLDDAAEARIREACPAAFHDYDSEEPFPSPICTCPIQRAAILADREAREKLIPEPTQENLRMSAYYYSFDPTGDGLVDRILSAVACAGKGYHHKDCAPFRGGSYIAWIQNAARDVAHARNAERAHADALAEMVRVLLDELDAYRSRERGCPCCDGHAPPYEDAETYHADDCSWVQADKLLAEHHRRRS